MADITLHKEGRSITVDQSDLQRAIAKGWAPDIPATSQIKAPPTGVAGAKSFGYTQAARAADLTTKNMDTLLGILGGVLGAGAGPAGAIAGSTLGGAAGRALQQLQQFSKGKVQPSSLEAAKDIGLAGLGQGVMEAGGAGIARIGKIITPVGRASRLAYATRSGELGPQIDRLIPEFDKTLKIAGNRMPNTVGEFQKVVEVTGKRLDNEFNLALQPIAGQQVSTQVVADAINAKVSPAMAKTPEGMAAMKQLEKKAKQFSSQLWTIRELNDERMRVTARLRSYHGATPSAGAAKARLDAAIAADQATESALKDILYDAADKSGAKPPGYFRELKQKQSTLIDMTDAVAKAKTGLSKASMERAGGPFTEKIHLRGYAHPATGMPGGVLGLSPQMFSDPLKQSSKAIQKAFPKTGRRATQAVGRGIGKGLSSRDINALPIRALFGDTSETQEKP